MLGYAAGAGAWLVQRAHPVTWTARPVAADDPRVVGGPEAGSMIGRGWRCGTDIFAAGMTENDAGLAAAVLVVVLFTAYFTVNLIVRPFDTDTRRGRLMTRRVLARAAAARAAAGKPVGRLRARTSTRPTSRRTSSSSTPGSIAGPLDINKAVFYVLDRDGAD